MAGNNPQNVLPHKYRKGAKKARENGIKGGIASGEAKRAKRTMREWAELLRDMPPPEWARKLGDTYGGATVRAIFEAAMTGDVAAFRSLVDLLGEKPAEKFEDITPRSPIILEMPTEAQITKAKADHDARQLENNRQH